MEIKTANEFTDYKGGQKMPVAEIELPDEDDDEFGDIVQATPASLGALEGIKKPPNTMSYLKQANF